MSERAGRVYGGNDGLAFLDGLEHSEQSTKKREEPAGSAGSIALT